MAAEKEFYTVKEVANIIGVSTDRVYEWLRNGYIKGTRPMPNSAWRVHKNEVSKLRGEPLGREGVKEVAEGNNQALQIEKQPVSMSGQDEAVRNHDDAIFRRSDSIMSEEEIRSFLSRLSFYCIYHFSELLALEDFIDFFEQESNKYILPDLRDSCNKMCHDLDKLTDFLLKEFDTTKQLKKETRPMAIKYLEATQAARDSGEDVLFLLHPEFRDENFLHFTHPMYRRKGNPTYLLYRDKLDELTKDTLESYSAYRVTIRDTLFI